MFDINQLLMPHLIIYSLNELKNCIPLEEFFDVYVGNTAILSCGEKID